jgi:hypothetical protein
MSILVSAQGTGGSDYHLCHKEMVRAIISVFSTFSRCPPSPRPLAKQSQVIAMLVSLEL